MKRRHAVALAAITGLVAGPLMSAVVAAGPVAVSTVVVITDPDLTDVSEEAPNVIEDLEGGGHTVAPIDDVTAENLNTALEGAEVLAMPEFSGSGGDSVAADYSDSLDAASIEVIRGFVDGGGRLLFFGQADYANDLNELFGFELEGVDDFCFDEEGGEVGATAVGDGCPLTAEAADTEFADGPALVTYANGSSGLDPATLPEGSTIAYLGQYDDGNEEPIGPAAVVDVVAVASLPYGDGAIIFFGWDWYPGESDGEDQWAEVLDLGSSQPEVSADSPAAGTLRLTMDSPTTQPVFVELVIDGTTHVVVIAAKTTEANFDIGGQASVGWTVPGWGIGEGTVEVAGATAAPPADPAPAAPTFTG